MDVHHSIYSSTTSTGSRFTPSAQLIILYIFSYIVYNTKYWRAFNFDGQHMKRQSIYILATISLANHYHNDSSKAFILRDRYKRFSGNGLPENLLQGLCVLSQKRTVIIATVLFCDNTHNPY